MRVHEVLHFYRHCLTTYSQSIKTTQSKIFFVITNKYDVPNLKSTAYIYFDGNQIKKGIKLHPDMLVMNKEYEIL